MDLAYAGARLRRLSGNSARPGAAALARRGPPWPRRPADPAARPPANPRCRDRATGTAVGPRPRGASSSDWLAPTPATRVQRTGGEPRIWPTWLSSSGEGIALFTRE